MTRILILGNSHAAAFKHAWETIAPEHPRVRISFFVLPGTEFQTLKLNPNRRIFGAVSGATTSKESLERLREFYGRHYVSLEDFDHVLVIGRQHGMLEILSMLLKNDISGLRSVGAGQLLSLEAFTAFRKDITTQHLPELAWSVLRDIKITFQAMPRYSETVETAAPERRWESQIAAPLLRQPDGVAQALDGLAADHRALLAEKGITFLQQPAETLTPSGFTRAQYSVNAHNILGHEVGVDYLHMNADFGAACLRAFLAHHRLLPRAA
jgi:hypothetical protein